MARVRSFLASLGRDELSTAARTVLGLIVVFVPFGSIVLLTRVPQVRRALQKLVDDAEACEVEAACVVHEECRRRADGAIRADREAYRAGDDGPATANRTEAHEVHEAK
jgi:hypothetical protein